MKNQVDKKERQDETREENREEKKLEEIGGLQSNSSGSLKQPVSSPQSEIPRFIKVDITPKVYKLLKERILRRFGPRTRSSANDFFEWCINIDPDDVIDAIEYGESLWAKYQRAPLGIRMSIATARAFIKVSPRLQKQFKDSLTPQLIRRIFQFENPEVYEVVHMYGSRGDEFIESCINDSFKIFGIKSDDK